MMRIFTVGIMALLLSTVQADIRRTPSGKPDLSGFYDIATLTPLSRPEELGDEAYMTAQQARKIAEQVAARREAALAQSDPGRDAPEIGGDGTAGAGGGVGGYNDFWLDYGSDRFQIDGRFRTSIITYPTNGRQPPLTENGKKRMGVELEDFRLNTGTAFWLDEGGKGPYDNMEQRPLRERCLLGFGPAAGPPIHPSAYNNLKRIVQTDDYVMILAEMVHDARVIRLDAEHNPDHMRTWMGDSIGRWQGDTLVVDTRNFLGVSGLMAADENLHVVERFRRVDEATLMYEFSVDDPTVWSDTWRGEYPWPQVKDKVYEYACHEGNYALGNIMRGARLLEKDHVQAKQASR